jgi:hypothetical protein
MPSRNFLLSLSIIACAVIAPFQCVIPAPANTHRVNCEAIPGLSQAIASKKARFLIFGELHGTSEIPAFITDVICQLSIDRPLVLALEFTRDDGQAVENYIHSNSPDAAASFLERGDWVDLTRDGRTSEAMLRMIVRLQQLVRAGRRVDVEGIIPQALNEELSQSYYELGIANELAGAASRHSEAMVVVLIGNVHARKSEMREYALSPAASLLPPADVTSLRNSPTGGSAWNCQSDTCGEHAITVDDKLPRGVALDAKKYSGYDGYFSVGEPYSTSKPASPHSRVIDSDTVPIQ